MEATEAKTGHLVKVLVGAHVRIEPDLYRWHGQKAENFAKDLERWAFDFREFVKDHRSQHVNGVEVVRKYETQCSECPDSEFEPMTFTEDEIKKQELEGCYESGKIYCAGCGVEMDD